ncbi:MAG: 7-cyano-7-deazaguanine synthase [Melioribacteraceae bacterium]|nr:7-cyano-7-deazaguanine synthase [Melioribacteraceae bacterium]MDD3558879.1 7-cyano-7-deazaguanine synthase [Melioribacteraceae bacterium]
MSDIRKYIVSCGGFGAGIKDPDAKKVMLEHREGFPDHNTRIKLEKLVNSVLTVNNRHKDLLNIAGYLFAADRKIKRGSNSSVEYHSWSRHIVMHIGVFDYFFWKQPAIQKLISDALEFMTGDYKFEFVFYQSDQDFPSSIFDNANFTMKKEDNLKVLLFSGGIDSLAGAVEVLENEEGSVCLVSHQSGQKTTISVQNKLFQLLQQSYPGKVNRYKFECGLTNESSAEESQRTRSFLFTAAAFVIAAAYGQNEIYIHENGITSLNLPETQDLINARSSRTTHPKTLALLETLFSAIAGEAFLIRNNFFFKTKTDVVKILKKYERREMLMNSVSCSSTRDNTTAKTHCGKCSQCVDRRFAAFAADVNEWDDVSSYELDFLNDSLTDDVVIKVLLEYIRLAQNFRSLTLDGFFIRYGPELADVLAYTEGAGDEERVKGIYELCQKHSSDIENALNKMQQIYDKPLTPAKPNSFFTLIVRPRAYQQSVSGSIRPLRIFTSSPKEEVAEEKNKDRELENAHNIIKHQKKRINVLEKGLTKDKMLELIENHCRKKNGNINYSELGRQLGCSNHAAKAKCIYFGIS